MQQPTLEELNLLHASICQALGDPKRIMILYAIHDRPRHVTALSEDLDMPQPTISRHLRVLLQRALVRKERSGPAVFYHLTDPRMIEILDSMRLVLRDSVSRQSKLLM